MKTQSAVVSRLLLCVLLIFSGLRALGQMQTFDAGDKFIALGESINLLRVGNLVTVKFNPSNSVAGTTETLVTSRGVLRLKERLIDHVGVWELSNGAGTAQEHDETMEALNSEIAFASIHPVYVHAKTKASAFGTDEMIIKLRNRSNILGVADMFRTNNLEIKEQLPRSEVLFVARLKNPKEGRILELCSRFHNSDMIEWTEPNFFFEARLHAEPTDDPEYSTQWYLKNPIEICLRLLTRRILRRLRHGSEYSHMGVQESLWLL